MGQGGWDLAQHWQGQAHKGASWCRGGSGSEARHELTELLVAVEQSASEVEVLQEMVD